MLRRFALSLTFMATLLLGVSLWAAEAAHEAAPQHGAAANEGAAAEGAHGRVHEVVEFDKGQAVWVLVIFLILLAILYPTAWKGVLEGLKKREERIRRDIANAEEARAKAEATLKEYQAQLATAENKVREMINGAVAQGEKMAAEIRAKGQSEAEQTKDRAMRDIEGARKQAISDLYATAADLSTNIASKILRRNLNADDQRDLVRQSLDQLQTVDNK
ncbi:MAG: F0F1 ATP synthase subunit B [Bacillota bacterium]